jgi:hypothetical protein
MAQDLEHGFRGFRDPLEIVDRTDLAYEERLATLQDWKAALAEAGAPEEQERAVLGAIQALEMGAAVQHDEPEEAPADHGYGAEAADDG